MLKFNQVKPGMVFLTNYFRETIILLSVDLSLFNNEWVRIVYFCRGGVVCMCGRPDDFYPHNLLQPD